MKITEQLKAELSQWLDTYWKTYLKSNLQVSSTVGEGTEMSIILLIDPR
jgi:hypothetical protein